MRLALIPAIYLLFTPVQLFAQHPNDSIAPEKSKPTPYGMQINRSDELQLDVAIIRDVRDLPPLAPYLKSFEVAEKEAGPYSEDLSQPLLQLGREYQARGRHREALQFFRRALHIDKVNEGLYTPSQLPAMSDMITSMLALNKFETADELHRVLFRIQSRAYDPDSVEKADATRRYVEWERQAYLQSIGNRAGYKRLLEIHELHSADIDRIRSLDPDSPALLSHLRERMNAEYLISQYVGERQSTLQISVTGPADMDMMFNGQFEFERFKKLKDSDFNRRNGRNTLTEILRLEQARQPQDSRALAMAYRAMGDWYLWWGENRRAMQNYETAWATLAEDGSAETNPDQLFEKPVELPVSGVFQTDGSVPTEDVVARARVSLAISRVGKTREIEILEQDPEGDIGARVVLFKLLRHVLFRPVVRNGEVVPFASLEREYRYQY